MKNSIVILFVAFLSGCLGSAHKKYETSPSALGGTKIIDDRKYSFSERNGKYYKIGNPYNIEGIMYYPSEDYNYSEDGEASWYGPSFHKKPTANGGVFNMHDFTAAHRTLPIPSIVRVTNLENGLSMLVKINDRGPYAKNRVIDLSKATAFNLGIVKKGVARVRVEVMEAESRAIKESVKRGYGEPVFNYSVQKTTQIDLVKSNTIKPINPKKIGINRKNQSTNFKVLTQEEKINKKIAPVENTAFAFLPSITLKKPQSLRTKKDTKIVNAPVGLVNDRSVVSGENNSKNSKEKDLNTEYVLPSTDVFENDIYLQVGVYTLFDNASRMKTMVEKFGEVKIYKVSIENKKLYAVRLGPYQNVDTLNSVKEKISNAGISVIVKKK